MSRVRAIMDGADAPVAQSHSLGGLRRRTPFADPTEHSYGQKSRARQLRRRQQEQEDDEAESESDGDSSSGDGVSGDDGVGTSSEIESKEAGAESGDEETLSPQQERLLESSPFSDFEVPTVPDLGALPMPPLNTRRSMRLDKIKRRSKRTLSARQAPEDQSTESGDGDGVDSSESEDEVSTTSGNAPPSRPPPAIPPPPPSLSPPETTAISGSSISTTSTRRELNPPISRTSTDTSFPSASPTNSVATITGTPSPTTAGNLEQSTFIAAADPTGNPTTSPDSIPSDAPPLQDSSGPAPESQTAIIAGVSVLGVALLVTLIYLLFRYCVPLRTWYATRLQKHRDDKAARVGTAPSPWKWPLQFIFGQDRPAPPRRQQQPQQHAAGGYYTSKEIFGSDLESQSPATYSAQSIPVADGFRPPQQPPEYKSYTTTSGGSWVANGWRAPLSHISQRLSSWPRRSGTARWFFGGGAAASRWSDSDAGNRTTYSEGQIVSMYGAGTAPPSAGAGRRSSITKSPLQRNQVQVSQVEVTTPMPIYAPLDSPQMTKTTIIKPPRPVPGAGLGLTQTPVRPRASPRNSYLARSSIATNATSGTGLSMMPPPPPRAPFANFSHFSASTVDPATPRRFDTPDVPSLPATPAPARRASTARFPVRTSSVSSVSSTRSSIRSSSRGGQESTSTPLTRGSDSIIGTATTDKPLPPVGMARGSGVGMM